MHEIIIDSFAGGGGTSLGIEWALGRSTDIAINHDPASIAMHAANHPGTLQLTEDVWHVDMRKHVGRRKVGLLWASVGRPGADLERLVQLGPWLKPATVAALLSVVAVGIFFVAGGIAERRLAAVEDSGIRLGVRITKAIGFGLAAAAVVALNRRGLLPTAWVLEPWVFYTALGMAMFGFAWWYLGLTAEAVYSGVCRALVWLSRGMIRHVVLLAAVVLETDGSFSVIPLQESASSASALVDVHPRADKALPSEKGRE